MNKYQPKPNKYQQQPLFPTALPIQSSIAVYPRQSTKVQLERHVTSTEMQTDDLIAYAKKLGWADDSIMLFDQDLGISGRKRIDEREGLSLLFEEIEKGRVKAILVFLEDRLFRDEKQIQPNIFIDFCRQYGVLVITPYVTYDFTIDYHRKLFRWKCEAAADYLRDYVVARLGGAKRRNAEQGLYDGRRVAFGYIVDYRQNITVDGRTVKNPTYKKYIVYEPHAAIIRYLFIRYIQLNGDISALYREICQEVFLFPGFVNIDAKAIGSRG